MYEVSYKVRNICVFIKHVRTLILKVYIYIYIILLMKTKSVKKYYISYIYDIITQISYVYAYHTTYQILSIFKNSCFLICNIYKMSCTNSKIYLKYYFFEHTQLPHYTILPYTTKRTLVKLINKYIDTAVVNNLLLLKTIFQNRNNN